MRERLTRWDFLKVAGAGTAGVAALGASAAFGSHYTEYLPKGGSKVNVILVILDSLRRDHVGAYDNSWIKTPNLDALAKQSLLFTSPYPEQGDESRDPYEEEEPRTGRGELQCPIVDLGRHRQEHHQGGPHQ